MAPVPYPTMHNSEQKCVHFCSEWCIVGYGTGALWDSWAWSIWHHDDLVYRDPQIGPSAIEVMHITMRNSFENPSPAFCRQQAGQLFNSSWPKDAIWHSKSQSPPLVQVMACRLIMIQNAVKPSDITYSSSRFILMFWFLYFHIFSERQ